MNSCVTLHFLGSEKSPRIINQNFRNGDLIEEKSPLFGVCENCRTGDTDLGGI